MQAKAKALGYVLTQEEAEKVLAHVQGNVSRSDEDIKAAIFRINRVRQGWNV